MVEIPARYEEWLKYIFEKDSYLFKNTSVKSEFKASHREIANLIAATCLRCGQDLSQHNDFQVASGISFIFNPSASNLAFSVKDESVSLEEKIYVLASLKNLYKDCFEPRCAPVLTHLSETGGTALNDICFMFWDVTPLHYWEKYEYKKRCYKAVLEVLEFALNCSNPACVESGLHGLGEVGPYTQGRTGPIWDRYKQRHPELRPDLRLNAWTLS